MFRPVWREFNRLIDYVRETQVASGRNVKVTRTMNGTMLLGEASEKAEGGKVRQLRVKEIGADWLRCRTCNGSYETTEDGTIDIYVARDPELRRTFFDGKTIDFSSDGDSFSASYIYISATKRTKTISGTEETQVIVPYYKLDLTIILAQKADTGVDDPDGTPIGLVEITQRAWAKL